MKSANSLNSWDKRQAEKHKRLRNLGWILMLISLTASSAAFFSDTTFVRLFVEMTMQEREGYYMMSVVFAIMSLFCLSSLWQNKN